jgi:hypothetical protein
VRAKVGRNVREGTVWMPWRLWDTRLNRIIETDAPFTAVTLTKVADAPKEGLESPLHSYAQGVGEGRPGGSTQGSVPGTQGTAAAPA